MSEPIKVLDHGYVRLVDSMGSDLSVSRAARVSYDAAWRAGEDQGSDRRLINYLWRVDPQFGIHRVVKAIKGRSSRLLRQEFPRLRSRLPTLWTNSYFVATTGGAPLSVIKQYIKRQKEV